MSKNDLSDRISKVMAERLLLGHRMLATCCNKCSCVLFEDQNGKEVCIRCDLIDDEMAQPTEPNAKVANVSTAGVLALANTGEHLRSHAPFQSDMQSESADESDLQQEVFTEARKVLASEIRLALVEFKKGRQSVSSRLESLKLLRSLAKTLRAFDCRPC
ncbi:Sjogren'S syndrome/scleroderma autoantigen 1 [Trichuris suis]|nr:Sjogren'S syndrome/scleroderma autoantigen 1 [Trichuris suis]